MKEEEAKTKWCPMAMSVNDAFKSTVSVNRSNGAGLQGNCNCVGSECMMWQWDDVICTEQGDPINTPDNGITGYCGLARKS